LEQLEANCWCQQSENAFDTRFALKGTRPHYSPDRTFDTEHIKLDLRIDLKNQVLEGCAQTTIRAIVNNVNAMTFNAVNFQIQKVLLNNKKVPYEYKEGKLELRFPKTFKEREKALVEIHYVVKQPVMGLFFLKPDRHYPQRPWQAWTQGEDEYARYWFPCVDIPRQRTTTELVATVPKGFIAISNGKLLKSTENRKKKTSTFHWLQSIPHAPYLVTLVVGRFSVIKDKWNKIPVLYYCQKGREEDTQRTFGKTPKMLDFFSKKIGVSYPYPKYAQVAVSDFIYGGMENTSATTQTDLALLDKRASLDYTSDGLVAHELAHQWFGDYLTCKDWSHAWLNESFATYFDALFKRHDKGEDEYLLTIHENSREYFNEERERYRRPIVTNVYKSPTDLFDRHLYEKGSVVLYMLHKLLGEELFWKSIHAYVERHRGKTVETADLINAFEDTTGRSLRQFFDQWVYQAGHPTYKIRSWWDRKKKEIHFRVVQSNSNDAEKGLFNIKTSFLIKSKEGEKSFPVTIDAKSHHFQFSLKSEPLTVIFDPDHRILKKVDFPRKEAYLVYQVQYDQHPIGRIEALQQLGRLGGEKALLAIREALLKDQFWAVQAEAAAALGAFRSENAAQILLNTLDVIENPKVRRAIYTALKSFKSRAFALAVEKQFKKEPSYFAQTNGLRALAAMGHPNAENILKEHLKTNSWNQIIRIAALEGFAELKSPSTLAVLLEHTKKGQHQRVRISAIRCLGEMGVGHTEIQGRLLELTGDDFLLVRLAAVRALHQSGDERAVPTLKKLTEGNWDGRLKRLAQEAVDKITKGFE